MTAALNKALVEAQKQLRAPGKNRTVKVRSDKGNYSFDYATLDAIVETTLRPVLPDLGLWFVQFAADGQMVTRIIHESGESMDCGIPMPNIPAKPQEAGSLISYFKRYSLCAAFGLVAEEDDDGNIAQGNGFDASARGNGGDKVSTDQLSRLQDEADATGADLARFCKYMGVQSLKEIPAAKFQVALDALAAKRRKEAA